MLMVVISSKAAGQVFVNDVDINSDPDIRYIELLVYHKLLIPKVTVFVDFGQLMKSREKNQQYIKDANGEKILFNSAIHALNFLEKNGWSYVDNYLIVDGSDTAVHFLLKRKEVFSTIKQKKEPLHYSAK